MPTSFNALEVYERVKANAKKVTERIEPGRNAMGYSQLPYADYIRYVGIPFAVGGRKKIPVESVKALLGRHTALSNFVIAQLFKGVKPEKAAKIKKVLLSVYKPRARGGRILLPPFGVQQTIQYPGLKEFLPQKLTIDDVKVLEVVSQRLKDINALCDEEERTSEHLMVVNDEFHLLKHTLSGMTVLTRQLMAHKIRTVARERNRTRGYLRIILNKDTVLAGANA